MLLAVFPHEFSMGSDLKKVHVVGRSSTCFFHGKRGRGHAPLWSPLKHEISMTFTWLHGTPWNPMLHLLHVVGRNLHGNFNGVHMHATWRVRLIAWLKHGVHMTFTWQLFMGISCCTVLRFLGIICFIIKYVSIKGNFVRKQHRAWPDCGKILSGKALIWGGKAQD